MLVPLHRTLAAFLPGAAPESSLLRGARIEVAIPDALFRQSLSVLTLNLNLYQVRENLELRRVEPWVERNSTGTAASRRRFPALVDCAYCITAWSPSEPAAEPVMEEHQLLAEALRVLLAHQRIPRTFWDPDIGDQMPPYPSVVAQPDASRNQSEFWTALGHPPKPSLTYAVTIAVPLHDDDELGHVVGPTEAAIDVRLHNRRPDDE